MNKETKDHFEVLRKVQKKPVISQREMAKELGFSLGKLNYCLRALRDKGLVKLKNFQKQKNKLNYLQYVITPKGISFRTKMTINFMKKKLAEYDELKKELKKTIIRRYKKSLPHISKRSILKFGVAITKLRVLHQSSLIKFNFWCI